MNVIVFICMHADKWTHRTFNQTLLRNLCKLIDDDKSSWDLKIETVLMRYRSSRQETTKQSPYYMYMLFQKQMCLPIDSEMILLKTYVHQALKMSFKISFRHY